MVRVMYLIRMAEMPSGNRFKYGRIIPQSHSSSEYRLVHVRVVIIVIAKQAKGTGVHLRALDAEGWVYFRKCHKGWQSRA